MKNQLNNNQSQSFIARSPSLLATIFLIVSILIIGNLAFADDQDDLAQEKKLSAEYLKKMSEESNAQELDQGVILRPLQLSQSGEYPVIDDSVNVLYHLVDREGKLIDESVTADEPVIFPLKKLIKCWQIAVPKISIGSFAKVSCPSDTAYGDKGVPNVIKPGAALTFRILVFGVKK